MKRRSRWWVLGLASIVAGSMLAPVLSVASAEAAGKDAPVKAVAALRAKIDPRIAPFKWGMTTEQVFEALDKQLDEVYAERISKAYNPKAQENLERERDKKKKDQRGKLTKFEGTGGVSGYEVKAPGEFTHKNGEAALETPRPGGGIRQLFFIGGKLWKIYDHVELTKKDAELGETWDQAIEKFTASLGGEKGKKVEAKSASAAFYGTITEVPQHLLWSDGITQVRLVDLTKREDMPTRTVAVAFEDLATLEKLPTLRTVVEKKTSDASVDRAGLDNVAPPKKKK